ncbi:MAG: type II secretion system protein K [marine bacterium B5-7]|nr:MAG: type II secretion system protein K [marine bacterium B5-7]
MAVVMLAIASTLAVGIWYNSQLSLVRITNLQKAYQAKHYSQGLLLWASDLLREDYAQDENTHDSSFDAWQQGIQGMVVEDAIISGSLKGLDGRFNVNNLIINGVKSDAHIVYLRQLLLILEMDVTLVDKMIDWIDADQVPEPNGAEDFAYLAKSPSYQTSGTFFQHIEELAYLDGLSREDYNRLLPYVTVLPTTQGATKMNVNFMSPPLFKALNNKLTDDIAIRLAQDGQADYTSMAAFYQHKAIEYVLNDDDRRAISKLLNTQTLFLQASSLVEMEASSVVIYALLRRHTNGSARVLSRSNIPYLPAP